LQIIMLPLTQAQRDLAEANQGLAWMVARRCHRPERGEDALQELRAIANLALCQAARGFNPELGFAFSTYAVQCCRQAIRDERCNGGLIPTPAYLGKRACVNHPYRPAREHVREASYSSTLLDEQLDIGGPVQQAERDEFFDQVRDLPTRERWVIECLLDGWKVSEISKAMKCSRFIVEKIKDRAIRQLGRSFPGGD